MNIKRNKLIAGSSLLILSLAIGNTALAGDYHVYADFSSTDGFLGGYDVDSYGNYLYVHNRWHSNQIDRYTVTTATAAGSDENTHPNNDPGPDGIGGTSDDNQGPMLTRTLSYDTTYTVPTMGGGSVSEIFAAANGLYFLDNENDVSFYNFSTTAISKITAASSVNLSQLTRSTNGTWYASNEGSQVYTYNETTNTWDSLFTHSVSPGGSHLDGLAAAWLDVTDDGIDNAQEWLFLADMTSDYIKRYALDGTFEEQYQYGLNGRSLEGMGFGANNHFWATSGNNLYEIGGGAFVGISEDNDNGIPEPTSIMLFGIGLMGFAWGQKKKA